MKNLKPISLLHFVLRCASGSDCTRNGLSSRVPHAKAFYLRERDGLTDALGFPDTEETKEKLKEYLKTTAYTAPEIFIIIEDICCGMRRLRAIPADLYLEGEWTMFGGNFLTTSDSRTFHNPIKIHDRVE